MNMHEGLEEPHPRAPPWIESYDPQVPKVALLKEEMAAFPLLVMARKGLGSLAVAMIVLKTNSQAAETWKKPMAYNDLTHQILRSVLLRVFCLFPPSGCHDISPWSRLLYPPAF